MVDLIDQDIKWWNSNIIKDIFNEEEARFHSLECLSYGKGIAGYVVRWELQAKKWGYSMEGDLESKNSKCS